MARSHNYPVIFGLGMHGISRNSAGCHVIYVARLSHGGFCVLPWCRWYLYCICVLMYDKDLHIIGLLFYDLWNCCLVADFVSD